MGSLVSQAFFFRAGCWGSASADIEGFARVTGSKVMYGLIRAVNEELPAIAKGLFDALQGAVLNSGVVRDSNA